MRTLGGLADLKYISTDVVALAVTIARGHFPLGENRFRFTKVDQQRALFETVHGAADDRIGFIVEFIEYDVAFGLADLLEDHLLRRLSGDSAEFIRDDLFAFGENFDAAGFNVDLDRDFLVLVVKDFLGGGHQSGFHRRDQNLAANTLLAFDIFQYCQ